MWYDELTEKEVKQRFEWANSTLSDDAIELLFDYYSRKREIQYLNAYVVESEWTEYKSVQEAVDALADNPQEVYGYITDEYADEVGEDKKDLIYEACSKWLDDNDKIEVVHNWYSCCVKKVD